MDNQRDGSFRNLWVTGSIPFKAENSRKITATSRHLISAYSFLTVATLDRVACELDILGVCKSVVSLPLAGTP